MKAPFALLQLAAAAAVTTSAYVIPDDQQALTWRPVDSSEEISKHVPSKDDIKGFLNNIEESLSDISDKVEDALEDLVEDVKENVDWAAHGFKHLKEDTYEKAKQAQQTVEDTLDYSWDQIDDAYEEGRDAVEDFGDNLHHMYFGSRAWLDETVEELKDDIFHCPHCGPPHHHHPPPPHHGPPDDDGPPDWDGPPHHGPPDWDRPPHHGPPHHWPPHHGPPDDERPPHWGPPHERPPHHGPPHHGPPHDGPPCHDRPPHHGPPHERPPHHGPPHERPPHDGPPPHHPPPHERPPHHGPPHERPPHHGPPHDGPPDERPPHHGPPHKRPPHHPPPDEKPNPPIYANATIYQLISESNYTTKLTKLINTIPGFVQLLNGTAANYTIFAPIDSAFDKFPLNLTNQSSGYIQTLLGYHISDEFYPAGRVLASKTIPTLLKSDAIGGNGTLSQRITTNVGMRGLTANFYSRVVVTDIIGTNGVIHGIDSLLVPPPKLIDILNLVPGEFSTLELGLINTGLVKELNSSSYPGGSFFAPTNSAFKAVDPRIMAFLFSHYGRKYLKALLKYHATPGNTLYSDTFYCNTTNGSMPLIEKNSTGVPKGHFHFNLPTMLKNKTLGADISRYGRFIDYKLNRHNRAVVSDIPTADGVLHVVDGILIPPKPWKNITIPLDSTTVGLADFKAALEPYLED